MHLVVPRVPAVFLPRLGHLVHQATKAEYPVLLDVRPFTDQHGETCGPHLETVDGKPIQSPQLKPDQIRFGERIHGLALRAGHGHTGQSGLCARPDLVREPDIAHPRELGAVQRGDAAAQHRAPDAVDDARVCQRQFDAVVRVAQRHVTNGGGTARDGERVRDNGVRWLLRIIDGDPDQARFAMRGQLDQRRAFLAASAGASEQYRARKGFGLAGRLPRTAQGRAVSDTQP